MPEREEERIRGPPTETAKKLSLEERLSEKPNLDMDLMQFLVIAGFTYDWEPLYARKNRHLLEEVKQRYKARRRKLPHRTKTLETTSARRLKGLYDYGGGIGFSPVKTLRELKTFLDNERGRVRVPNYGVVTFAYLNTALRHYGIGELNIYVPQREKNSVVTLIPYCPNP